MSAGKSSRKKSAKPAHSEPAHSDWAHGHPSLVVMLAAGILLFGGGLGIGLWLSAPDRPAPNPIRQASAKPSQAPETVSLVAPKPSAKPYSNVTPVASQAPKTESRPKPVASITAPPPQSLLKPRVEFAAISVSVRKGQPMIAIVLDDLGIDKNRSSWAIELPAPLTLAFLPYASGLKEQTERARALGHELLVHLPMQPKGHNSDPGPNVLDMRLGEIEVLSRLDWNLSQFSGYVGANNHMGSLFTESETGMRLVAEEMRERGLMYLDSLTSPKSQGWSSSIARGVPAVKRDVFLDNVDTLEEVKFRLEKTEEVAVREGSAIAIGHPRDSTLAVLQEWIPDAIGRGFAIVPLTQLSEHRNATVGAATRQASTN